MSIQLMHTYNIQYIITTIIKRLSLRTQLQYTDNPNKELIFNSLDK